MKEICFNVFCSGVYESKLIVDDDFCTTENLNEMSDEEFFKVLDYINRHLNEAKLLSEISWINDVGVDADDVRAIYSV